MRVLMSAAFTFVVAVSGVAIAGADLRLIDAAKRRDTKTIQLLVREHVDVNTTYGDGTTALHWAAYWGDKPSAELLLGAGADPNKTTGLGVPPLHLACQNGS